MVTRTYCECDVEIARRQGSLSFARTIKYAYKMISMTVVTQEYGRRRDVLMQLQTDRAISHICTRVKTESLLSSRLYIP